METQLQPKVVIADEGKERKYYYFVCVSLGFSDGCTGEQSFMTEDDEPFFNMQKCEDAIRKYWKEQGKEVSSVVFLNYKEVPEAEYLLFRIPYHVQKEIEKKVSSLEEKLRYLRLALELYGKLKDWDKVKERL